MMNGRKILSFVLGLILLAVGIIPMLNVFGVIGFTIPDLPLTILWVLALIGALFLIIDGFKEMQGMGFQKMEMLVSLLTALVIIVLGLGHFGVFSLSLGDVARIILNILLTIGGILLILGGFAGY
jgi:hypothetical protein